MYLHPNQNVIAVSVSTLLLRLAIGVLFIYWGWPKLLNIEHTAEKIRAIGLAPGLLLAVLIAFAQTGGGLALILGFRTRLTTLVLLAVTLCTLERAINAAFRAETIGMTRDIYYLYEGMTLAVLLSLLLTGAGEVSLDHALTPGPPRPVQEVPVGGLVLVEPPKPAQGSPTVQTCQGNLSPEKLRGARRNA